MTDLVIGFAANYDWPALEPFAVSLARSGYTGKKVLFAQKLTAEACEHLQELGFELLPLPVLDYSDAQLPLGSFFAYVARFLLIHRYLYDHPQYRFVVTCDARDVIFQSDPMVWLEKNIGDAGLVAASEYIYHWAQQGNTAWVKAGFQEVDSWMMSQIVYCSGFISGRAEYMKDLCLAIYLIGRHLTGKIWGADQPAYNAIMHQKPYADITLVPTIDQGYCFNLCVVAFEEYRQSLLESPPPLVYGSTRTDGVNPPNMWDYDLADLKQFAVLHQYDRMPELTQQIRSEYRLATVAK